MLRRTECSGIFQWVSFLSPTWKQEKILLRFSAVHKLQFRFSYPGTSSYASFCFGISALMSCEPLYPSVCFSNLGDSVLPCELTFLMDLRKVYFSVGSAPYLLLEWSGDFKLKIPQTKNLVLSFQMNKIQANIV